MMMHKNRSKSYGDITRAIHYLSDHALDQPSLDDVARATNLSPSYLQRLFTQWVGISPKQFLIYISREYAKKLLSDSASTLHTATATGLSGTGRLHDLFITTHAMTPGEYKSLRTGDGAPLTLHYSFASTRFGDVIIASTPKGVTHLTFIDSYENGLTTLREAFPFANLAPHVDPHHTNIIQLFESISENQWDDLPSVALHLKGTPFQLHVWEALLRVPYGNLTTYGSLAHNIGRPHAHRAVGTAVGKNPISFLIPCHRVIKSTGIIGNYMWGEERKKIMIAREYSSVL